MNGIPLDEITVPENRQRKEFDKKSLDELADSILSKGLLHPIVLRNDNRTLLAGERRFRALCILTGRGKGVECNGHSFPPGYAPYTLARELTPLELFEAELEENTQRTDLTWQERSEAIANLHKLRTAQAEERGEKYTQADTARELLNNLGVDIETTAQSASKRRVANALKISEHLDDPDVLAAKSEREALKVIEKKNRAAHRAKLAAEFGTGIESLHTFHHGDAFEILPTLEGPFDLMITDPPYGVGADTFGEQAGARHDYKDDITFALRCYAAGFSTADRCGVRALFAFCDIRVHPTLVEMGRQLLPDWSIWDTPLIWDKGNGMLPVPEKGPRRNYEAILYAYRAGTVWSTVGSSDVFSIPGLSNPTFGAEKPVDLYSDLLGRVCLPGDRVLDPFAGTCPVVGAADKLQLVATCIEMNKEKLDYAALRYTNLPKGAAIPGSGG